MSRIVCASEWQGATWKYGPHEVHGEIPDRCPKCGMALYGAPGIPLTGQSTIDRVMHAIQEGATATKH